MERCESILERLQQLRADGRVELQPNTTSFNCVIDCLAHSNERGREQRAEAVLHRMNALKDVDPELYDVCKPDQLTFNILLKCWALSKERGAARRAEAILLHMEKRYESGATSIQPDAAAYNTCITAIIRSGEKDSIRRAQDLLQRMEQAYQAGNQLARPNVISYNIVISGLAKLKQKGSLAMAMEMVEMMKQRAKEDGNGYLQPDVFTYTSLLKGLAESSTTDGADLAEKFLTELEAEYKRSGRIPFKPTIQTYTSVVHVIARSQSNPYRALDVVHRMERLYASGELDIQPDVGCYNSLINAFGWAKLAGRGKQAYEIFQSMLASYQSGKNRFAKPDIITCNSVINACAYEVAESEEDRADLVRMAIDTLETFQRAAPKFGSPNHISFATVLLALSTHMPAGDKRTEVAEATFWQCCQTGHVSVLVINHLEKAIPYDRLAVLLGSALQSKEGEPLGFNWRKLPSEWTRSAPKPTQRRDSRPSQRHPATKLTRSLVPQQR